MWTNVPFRTLADYIHSVNKVESEKVEWQKAIYCDRMQANYEFISKSWMRIPCHNRATQLYYQTKEAAEGKLKTNR